ncbi:YadA-like family protein [Haemophilus influenzae]|uniref:YadA-like family protein n=1 Tax=Haemophilus influenzae TaxID=727 RepID=UPI00030D1DEC|nr:YadA-like family protein [Haemophilus influenzae]
MANASNKTAIAIGVNTTASNVSAIALGHNATSSNVSTIAIGNASATQKENIAIGNRTFATGQGAMVIGINSTASGNRAIVFGEDSKASEAYTIAIGHNATASKGESISIGYDTKASGKYSVTLGPWANALEDSALALGAQAKASGKYSVAIGRSTSALKEGGIAIGLNSATYAERAIAQGFASISTGDGAIAIGDHAISQGKYGISIGVNSAINNVGTATNIIIGNGAYAGRGTQPSKLTMLLKPSEQKISVDENPEKIGGTEYIANSAEGIRRTAVSKYRLIFPKYAKQFENSIAFGTLAQTVGHQSIAFGAGTRASGADSLSFGIAAESRGHYSLAIGSSAVAKRESGIAIGRIATAHADNSVSIGTYSQVIIDGGVALGDHSIADRGENSVGVDFSGKYTGIDANNHYILKGELKTESEAMQTDINNAKERFKTDVEKYSELSELRNLIEGEIPAANSTFNSRNNTYTQLQNQMNSSNNSKPKAEDVQKAKEAKEKAEANLNKLKARRSELETKHSITMTSDAANNNDSEKNKKELEEIENKLTALDKQLVTDEGNFKDKQTAQNKIVSVWRGTTGAFSVGNRYRNLTRQITGVAAGTADTDAVNLAQLKSAGLRFAVNSDDKGFAGTDKTHNFYKHVGETLSILGESGVGYKADLYSSRNLITYHDNDGIRIAMKTNPVFDRLTLVNKDDPNKSLELYAKTGDDGKAHLIQAEKAPEANNAAKEKPQTPNNGTDSNHNTARQGGTNGQNGQAGGSSSTGNAGSQGSNGTTGHNGSTGQDGANGQNGANANHGINSSNGSNGLSANETDLTRAAIKGLNQATGEINRQIRKTTRENRAGIAAAMAMGQIYPVQGKRFTVGAAAGTYRGQSAVAAGVRYTPKPNMVISLSGSADTNNGVGAATGVSFGF